MRRGKSISAKVKSFSVNQFFFRRGELLSILIAFAMPLCIGVFSALDWRDYRENRSEFRAAQGIFEDASELLIAVTDAETGERGFILTGDTAYLGPYERALPVIRRDLDLLDAATARDNSAHDQVRRLRAVTDARLDGLRRAIDLRRQGDAPKSLAVVQTGEGSTLMDSIRRLTGQIRAEEHRVTDARSLLGRSRFRPCPPD